MTSLDHALAYASFGWRVAPIPPGYKYPKGLDEWQREATTDVATITAWWMRSPDHGVSIVTGAASGIFVVDVDPRHGGDETLADLEHEHGALPDTVETITGGGGRHLYFRTPDGVTIATEAGKRLGLGLDVRGEGGQVVAPPTIHPETNLAYEWEAMSNPFEGVMVADAPAWLLELLTVDLTPPTPRRAERPLMAGGAERPGDRFEAETEWADLLASDGWTLHSARNGRQGDYELWTRPGKDVREGASASLYYQGSDVLKVFTSSIPWLGVDATYTRFGYFAARHHGGDHAAAARELGRRYSTTTQALPVSSTSSRAPEPEERPFIVHNGRQLDDVTRDAITAIAAANDPPEYFVRAGQLSRLRPDEDRRPLIESLRPEHARLALADAATWWRANKDGDLTATSPPADVATSVLARGSWPLPPLAGVVELPVLRPDGRFVTAHGYDEATSLYHWHPSGDYADVADEPTQAELDAAIALVSEALCDFPWDTAADRANAWGLLLTPLIRPIVGQVPMALIDAPEPGTGKGLLVTVAATIALGRSAGLAAWPATEEELAKVITATLMAGTTMVIFDNVEGVIRSANLAAALTANVWTGRVLGKSENATIANRATWVATGNNVDVGGDLARRCYRIRLDARQAQPWKRSDFRHPDLERWVTENRSELLHALCTIVRSWWVAGRHEAAAIAAMGGYTSWVRVVGGILEHAGIGGFLGNLSDFHAAADQDAQQWEAFLTTWLEAVGETPMTTAELVEKIRDLYTGSALRDVLPEDLAGHVDSPTFNLKLGRALRKRTGRHFGADGIHLTEMPKDRRQLHIWVVTNRPMTLLSDEPPRSVTDKRGDADQSPRSEPPVTCDDGKSAGIAGIPPLATGEKKLSTGEEKMVPTAPNIPAIPASPRSADHDEIGLL